MKHFLLVISLTVCTVVGFCQSPLNWAKTFGGKGTDAGEAVQQTIDSGFIIAGYSNSISSQITGSHGGLDFLVIKTDKNGNVQWQKAYGGSSDDAANSVELVPGGYIVGGWSQSRDGDVIGNHGSRDYWIIKIDSVGTLLWQKCLGGSNNDELTSLEPTTDSGYIVSGFSLSNDGEVSGNHGGYEYGDDWIVKLSSKGEIQWQKSFGGNNDEYPREIHETKDGGYIVSGYSSSINGNITNNHGGEDYWVFKLSSAGVLQWQQSFGGTGNDVGEGIKQTQDGGYVVNGYSNSYKGGQIPGNKGENDYWVIKITSTGTLQWSKNFGGSLNDQGGPVQLTPDGGYLISGHSQSNDGDVTGHHVGSFGVNFDYWILKLDSTGKLQWEKCFGGSGDDVNYNTILNKNLGYTLVGYSFSADGDVVGNQGGQDFWVINLGTDTLLANPVFPAYRTISAFAGTGVQGYNGDYITATSARLALPDGVATDKAGNVYIADTYNNRVRKVSKNGIITTVAGNGGNGYSGDNGLAAAAQIYEPEAVAVDDSGSIYIADFGNQVVRKVNPQGIITTIAGNHTGGFSGDGGPATSAQLSGPYDICLDPAGNLIIADWRNNRIRKVNKQGIISTIAGTGAAGYNGDGEKAVLAELNNPYGITVDKTGNIYIGDSYNNRIRKISALDSTISTVAGTGVKGNTGDSGLATMAELNTPIGLQFDAFGNLVFADFDNHKIRKISPTGIITTVAGTGLAGYTGDNGNPLAAEMNHPVRVAIDTAGNLYVSERDNDIVRKISSSFNTLPVTLTNFTAYSSGKDVQTAWTGYDEVSMSRYEVERSANGYQFYLIGSVAAKNNGAAQNGYSLLDVSPLQGGNYYRVKAISKDGGVQYSGVVLVKIASDVASIAIYPNPVANKAIQIHLNNVDAGVYQYTIYSSTGKQVAAGSHTHTGGSDVITIDAASLAKGIYHVVFKGGKNGYTLKVLVM